MASQQLANPEPSAQQPTSQQLAYLDELKQRLQQMRMRQETFMEETAEILRKINPDETGLTQTITLINSKEEPPNMEKSAEVVPGIKQLIQRFEDLRQTSRQFSDQPTPEELVGVDVRKLLKGYEKLIVEGDILQSSWLLLKKNTESCAQTASGSQILSHPRAIKCTRFDIESTTQTCEKLSKRKLDKTKHQRFGALLQMLLCIIPFHESKKRRTP